MLLKVLAFILIIPGAFIVYGSSWIVRRFKLDEKTKVDFKHDMEDEELTQYMFNKAVVRMKVIGLTITLPGILLVFYAFR